MKKTIVSPVRSALCLALAFTATLHAANFTWSGAGGADVFWSSLANWSPAGPPGAADGARFFDDAATNDLFLTSSVIGTDTAINSLWLGQTNGIHNLLLNPGVTLTISGTNHNGYGPLGSGPEGSALDPALVNSTLYVGTKQYVLNTTTVSNTISGPGTLVLNNTNNEINVRQTHTGGTGQRAILDLSGLDNLVANLGRIRVGDGESEPIRRAHGLLFLAKTNTITLTGTNSEENVQLVVGNNDINNNGNGSISYLHLGQQNTINVNHVLVGGRKQQGNISFLPGLVDPALRLRGSDGVSRVVVLRIGDHSNQLNTGNSTTGNLNLGGGTVDALVDTIYVGRSSKQGTGPATGHLTLGAGMLDVNTVEVAFQTTDLNTTSTATGTVNVNGTTVVVNNLLRLARSAGSATARTATLNLNGGSVTVNGSYKNEGTVNINVTNGLLALPAGAAIVANNVQLDGGVISNAASIRVTNTLVLVNGGDIPSSPVFDMGNSGFATWDVQGAPGGGLTISNVLQGGGNYFGDLIQAPGGTLIPGGSGAAGTLAVQPMLTGGNITLNAGTLRYDLPNSALSPTDLITAAGTVTLNATNDVILTALGGNFDTGNAYTLLTAGTLIGNQNNFRVAGALSQSRYVFTFDTTSTPNAVKLSVGGTGPSSLTWVGDGAANVWQAQGAANWNNGASSAFFSLDSVHFNDAGSDSPALNLTGTLIPGGITMNNSARNYTFSGSGSLSSSGPLVKSGTGSLTLNNSAGNSFSSLVTISNGAVTLANSGQNIFGGGLEIFGGSLILSGNNSNEFAELTPLTIGAGTSLTVANTGANNFGGNAVQLDGSLTVNQSVDSTIDGVLTGSGTLIKSGSGTLTLSGINAGLGSIVQIIGGTVRAAAPSSLGSVGVTIAPGAKLNLSGQNFAGLPVVVGGAGPDGAGAIVNNGAAQESALANVTLTGNTAFGGSGPWSTDPVQNSGRMDLNGGSLSTGNQPFALTKVGLNQFTLRDSTVDDALGNIDVQAGLLALQGSTGSLGNPANTLIVHPGATVSFFDTATAWNKKFVLMGNGATPSLMNYNGNNTVMGAVTLNGECVISCVPPDRGAPVVLTLSGVVGGSGAFIKRGHDTTILSAINTYSGATTVGSGTLNLTGDGKIETSPSITIAAGATLDATTRTDGTLTLASGQTLQGDGAVSGTFVASPGSTVSPGASLGALSFSNAVSLNGTVRLELNATTGTNDVILAPAGVTMNNTLIVLSNLSGTLTDQQTFVLFSAPPMSGSFTVQPATPGPGQTWNTGSLLSEGWIKVVGNPSASTPRPHIVSAILSGANLVISGTNGTPGGVYYVLAGTNVAQPVADWERIATNQFSSGNFTFTNVVTPGAAQRFFLLQIP